MNDGLNSFGLAWGKPFAFVKRADLVDEFVPLQDIHNAGHAASEIVIGIKRQPGSIRLLRRQGQQVGGNGRTVFARI